MSALLADTAVEIRASGVQLAWLADGRLHLQHGPIDLLLLADGTAAAQRRAFTRATERFDTVLRELVAELPELRRQLSPDSHFDGAVAQRMRAAAAHHASSFYVTPMIAVAGAVADEILSIMCDDNPGLLRASVNNGGDIALYLSRSAGFDIALVNLCDPQAAPVMLHIGARDPIRGIATSGWQGRSHSLGIADSVSALADSAAGADAAATLIANAIDLPGDRAVQRVPANTLDSDTDLCNQPVTIAVERLSAEQINRALDSGQALAERMLLERTISGACMVLQGRFRTVGIDLHNQLPAQFSATPA